MKNQPNKIFLQTALKDNEEDCDNFDELVAVSWCADKIYEDDLEYISSSLILARIKKLEELKFDTLIKHGQHDFNINSAVINELKNLLK